MSSTYNNTEKLRFWCQKVLPLVYDDSLSYYELLNKVVVYLNSTIEDVQAMIADVTRIEQGLSSKIDLTQKGVPNGVATLNGQGQVPLTQLPDISAGVQTISVNGVNVPADANKNVNIIVMTNAVSNLVNYYLKTETYNKTEVNALIDSVKNSRFEVVTQLPTTDIQTNVIYLVPKSVGQTQNGYDEFINLDGTTSGWELIGSTDIDLSGYVTDSELATALSAYVTTQSLNTTLAGYVTSGALDTTLEGYVTQMSFESLQSTVTSQGNTLAGLITTVNGKVDKVAGKGLSTNDYSNADKGVVDKIQDNVIANTKLIKDTVGWSGKNKWVTTANNNTAFGYIFNINPTTKKIHITGSHSGADAGVFECGLIHLEAGIYKLTGAVGGISQKLGLQVWASSEGTDQWYDFDGSEKTINIATAKDCKLRVWFSGVTSNVDVTFEPMIRSADILDSTYEPYFGSTAFPRSEQAVLGARNLVKFPYVKLDGSYSAVSVTVNKDGSLLLNGTASTDAFIIFHVRQEASPTDKNPVILKAGTYNIYKGDNANDVSLRLNKTVNGSAVTLVELSGSTKKGTFTLTEETQIGMIIDITNGTVVTNNVVKPMITFVDDKNETITPYAMTNRELTEKATKSSWTDSTTGIMVSKVSGVVMIDLGSMSAVTADIDEAFCTIPSEYRPSSDVSFLEASGNKRIVVKQNGQVLSKAALSSTSLRGVCTYII